jgi:hypothetical protein
MLSTILRWLGIYGSTPPARPKNRGADLKSRTGRHNPRKDAPQRSKPSRVTTGDGNFDPYNTGKFDRGASWERISKNQR